MWFRVYYVDDDGEGEANEDERRMSKGVRGAHDDVVYVYKLSTGKMQLQKLNESEYKNEL